MSKRIATAVFSVLLIWSGLAAADTPLDLANPVARDILVQVDEDVTDFAAIGAAFGTPVVAGFVSNGTIAVVTVPGSVVEDLVETVFGGSVGVVPGTFTDYVVVIDVASGEVTSATISGQLDIPILGAVAFTQSASSTEVAGFELMTLLGIEYPAYCTSGAGCTIVPGQAYNPATGQLNAVGQIAFFLDVFTPFGDLRLTEVPSEPICEVTTSQPIYVDGEQTVLTDFRFGNLAGQPLSVRLKLELGYSTVFTATLIDVGAGGGLVLPGGIDINIGPLPLLPVTAALPRGSWFYRCALEDPTSGTVLSEDTAPFEIQ